MTLKNPDNDTVDITIHMNRRNIAVNYGQCRVTNNIGAMIWGKVEERWKRG